MEKEFYEIKDYDLETVEDMIRALLKVPKGYLLHPLGQKCKMAVNYSEKCVHLDEPNWIDGYKEELKENIDQNSTKVDVSEEEIECFSFGYMWTETENNDGVYTYFETVSNAKDAFDKADNVENKTYGTAGFVDGRLEPLKVIGSTL